MAKSRYAKNMAVAAFVNLSKVVEYLKAIGSDFWVVCAGKAMGLGSFSLEDAVCAGMILDKLEKEDSVDLELSDSSRAALALYKSFGRSILKMMKASDHGRYLQEIGFEEDIKICAAVDSVPVVPILNGNVIKLRKEDQRENESEPSSK
jgi:2-phosphosulfolactate phosphatase